jgi:hypothetical protein
MWLLVEWLAPERILTVWVLVVGFLFWFSLGTMSPYVARGIPEMFLWTDIINLVAVEVFNEMPTYYWAHGWTVSLLFMVTGLRKNLIVLGCSFTVWLITLWLFGPSLVFSSANIGFND